jgi:hypothetical protein
METREKSFFFVYVASRGGIESRCSTPLNALSPRLSHSQISCNRFIQPKRRASPASWRNMKAFIVVLVVCLSCGAYGDDKKTAKAIAVLGFSDKVFGSE